MIHRILLFREIFNFIKKTQNLKFSTKNVGFHRFSEIKRSWPKMFSKFFCGQSEETLAALEVQWRMEYARAQRKFQHAKGTKKGEGTGSTQSFEPKCAERWQEFRLVRTRSPEKSRRRAMVNVRTSPQRNESAKANKTRWDRFWSFWSHCWIIVVFFLFFLNKLLN